MRESTVLAAAAVQTGSEIVDTSASHTQALHKQVIADLPSLSRRFSSPYAPYAGP
jgi:hypothetical protein